MDESRQPITPTEHISAEPNDEPIPDLRRDAGQLSQHVSRRWSMQFLRIL